jgi:hypothetical protein
LDKAFEQPASKAGPGYAAPRDLPGLYQHFSLTAFHVSV